MSWRRGRPTDRDLIFAEYFNDQQSVLRNGGIPTDVTFENGVAKVDSSNIEYIGTLNLTGSVRLRIKASNISTLQYIIDFREEVGGGSGGIGFVRIATNTISISAGITYINGEQDNSLVGYENEFIDVVAVGVIIDSRLINVATRYGGTSNPVLLGEIELLEIYNKALTAEEVTNLFLSKRYRIPQLGNKILHVTARKGVVQNTLSGDTIQGELVPEVVVTDTEVVKEGSIYTPRFNGSSSKIDCGDYNDLTGDITVLAWVNRANDIVNFDNLLSNGQFRLYYFSDVLFARNDNGASGFSTNIFLNENGNWMHIAVVRKSSGSITFYKDAVDVTASDTAAAPVAGTSPIQIGPWGNKIAETQILLGLLTLAEISQYYSSTKHLYQK